jgi:hypothetical protein
MTPDAQAAIHAVRMKRIRVAMQALEDALAQGRAVSQELLLISGLLERGIDPRQIRTAFSDLPRLLETARAIEAQQLAEQERDPRRAARRVPV